MSLEFSEGCESFEDVIVAGDATKDYINRGTKQAHIEENLTI